MSDRVLLERIRAQLAEIALQLDDVRMRTAAGARGGALHRARIHCQNAACELPYVLSGPLQGDAGVPSPDLEPRFIGLDTARHTRGGDALR